MHSNSSPKELYRTYKIVITFIVMIIFFLVEIKCSPLTSSTAMVLCTNMHNLVQPVQAQQAGHWYRQITQLSIGTKRILMKGFPGPRLWYNAHNKISLLDRKHDTNFAQVIPVESTTQEQQFFLVFPVCSSSIPVFPPKSTTHWYRFRDFRCC
jgi:hypothetical protein